MPIDFAKVESGEEFELLCEDLLQAMGFTIEAKVARNDCDPEWRHLTERLIACVETMQALRDQLLCGDEQSVEHNHAAASELQHVVHG